MYNSSHTVYIPLSAAMPIFSVYTVNNSMQEDPIQRMFTIIVNTVLIGLLVVTVVAGILIS